jgi:hypothetical protein
MTLPDAIITALRLYRASSTNALCEVVGRKMNLSEREWCVAGFKSRVYYRAKEMERIGILVSAKFWNGRSYERVWRRA